MMGFREKRGSGLFSVLAVALTGLGALYALDMARGEPWSALGTPAFAAPPEESAPKAADTGDKPNTPDDDASRSAPGQQAGVGAPPGRQAGQCPPSTLAARAGLSRSELSVLSSLSERRAALDALEAQFAIRENTLAAAEARLESRVEEIKTIRDEVEALLGQLEGAQQAQVDELVGLYETMKPEDAARILPGLDPDIRLAVAAGMKDKTLASILGLMTQEQAIDLTMQLARRHGTPTDLDQPFIADRMD